jgi:hypothetical protein
MMKQKYLIIVILYLALLAQSSCKKFVEVDVAGSLIGTKQVFSNDANATAAVIGIYIKMMAKSVGVSYIPLAVTTYSGLCADELKIFKPAASNSNAYFYINSIGTNSLTNENIWSDLYGYIFTANLTIENLEGNTQVSSTVNDQLLGEVKFIRAFSYFYLTNIYGDVPLLTHSDYNINRLAGRNSQSAVYNQMITDLKDAQRLLRPDYSISENKERVRPNKWAATALLARVYLYTGNWNDAESQSTAIIANTSLFSLPTIGSDSVNGLNTVFKKNSLETIWALKPVLEGLNTSEAEIFMRPAEGLFGENRLVLSDQAISAFEPGDLRRKAWINPASTPESFPDTNYYVNKYKVGFTKLQAAQEYSIVLRVAEQYLIRAEARAMQNNLKGAAHDLNRIRAGAGLSNAAVSDLSSLLKAVLKERQVELFCEFGHRWFDLKRTKNIDAVMNVVSPLKNAVWNTNFQLYPIPQNEILNNINLTQNTGYN